MDLNLIAHNLLNPPILFFFLGLLAVAVKSDLDIPQPISKFLSLYLLFAIGLKGGEELAHSTITTEVIVSLLLAVCLAFATPIYAFFVLRRKFNAYNAAAIAATYGSISAVTFITAVAYLQSLNEPFGGHMVAAMALMESPAIIVGVVLANKFSPKQADGEGIWKSTIKEGLTNGSVILILGSLIIGLVSAQDNVDSLHSFTENIFKGMLSFFLLDMGLIAAKRMKSLQRVGWFAFAFALLLPLFNAFLTIGLCVILNISSGNALLLVVLAASASYIAVPAAMRIAIPEANPGLYVPLSLAVTFPFNIIFGIPLYHSLIHFITP